MDPVSQATLGAALPQVVARPERLRAAAVLGALSGMAPDLDVLIRSAADPLLFLEYHRQFTHALVFIPLGALLCASVLYWPFRRSLRFVEAYLFCLLGYATHGLLDACTTYGTLLLWPFSDARIAWNTVAVVDPLFTLPLLALVVAAAVRRQPRWAAVGLAWALAYQGAGVVQRERAESAGLALAASRGHAVAEVSAKPALGSLLLWKTVYRTDGHFHVDAVRTGWDLRVFPGDQVEELDLARHLPWLDPASQQARDVERFRWFSAGYLALDRDDPQRVVDVRYSMLPNEIDALWGIELDPAAPADAHVRYVVSRDPSDERLAAFRSMLFLTGRAVAEGLPPPQG